MAEENHGYKFFSSNKTQVDWDELFEEDINIESNASWVQEELA